MNNIVPPSSILHASEGGNVPRILDPPVFRQATVFSDPLWKRKKRRMIFGRKGDRERRGKWFKRCYVLEIHLRMSIFGPSRRCDGPVSRVIIDYIEVEKWGGGGRECSKLDWALVFVINGLRWIIPEDTEEKPWFRISTFPCWFFF